MAANEATGVGHGEQDRSGSRLEGRRCIVTGAARGIGAEIAATFRSHGARLGLLDIDTAVKAVADDLDAVSAIADVGDPVTLAGALDQLIGELGGVDVLVNNAGILRITPLLDISVEEWGLVQDVNARSMLVGTQVAARAMIAGSGTHRAPGEIVGKIINMSSMGAKRGGANQAHYSASKAAVLALTQVAAVELGPHGITVNAICPGYVLTEMGAATRTPEMVTSWSASSPLGRCAEPADVAAMALFLASTDGDYTTGQAMNVAGGMIMH